MSWDGRSWWTSNRVLRLVLMAALWLSVAVVLVAVREVLLPFGTAVLLAYVLQPAVAWLNTLGVRGRRVPRWVATVGLYVVMATGLYVGGRAVAPQVAREVSGLGKASTQAVRWLDDNLAEVPGEVNAFFRAHGVPVVLVWEVGEVGVRPEREPAADGQVWEVDLRRELARWTDEASQLVGKGRAGLVSGARGAVSAVVGFIFKLFLVLMLAAFILSDTERIKRFFLTMVPREKRESFDALLGRVDRGLSGVVRGQVTICLVNGVLTLAGLLLLDVKFAFLLSGVAAVFSLVPIFGSILSSVPIVAVALTDGLQAGVLVLLWIIGIHLVEANFLNPKIMGEAAKIHPVVVVLALVAGEHFYGITGALFAVPITSIGLTVFKSVLSKALKVQAELPPGEGEVPPASRTL
jgi:predicted PurR-regulated permease PerM